MAKNDDWALCSNPKCGYNKTVPFDTLGCPLCGSDLILRCPHCFRLIVDGGLFCMYCKRQMKTQLKVKRTSQAGHAPELGKPKMKTRLHDGQDKK